MGGMKGKERKGGKGSEGKRGREGGRERGREGRDTHTLFPGGRRLLKQLSLLVILMLYLC